LFAGLAFLTKREPALLFFYLSVVPWLLVRRELRELLTLGHLLCVITILFCVGVWLVPVISEVGVSAYLANLTSQAGGVGRPWTATGAVINLFYYPAEAWGSGLPWSLLLLTLLSPAVRRALFTGPRRDMAQFAALAAVINLIPYVFFRLDLSVRYYLPMVPTMLVLATLGFDALAAVSRDSLWAHAVRVTTFLLSIIATVLAVALIVGPYTRYVRGIEQFPMPNALLAILGLGLVALSAWSSTRVNTHLRQGLLLAMLALCIGFRLDDINLSRPHRALMQSRNDNAAAFVARLREQVPATEQPIRVSVNLPYAVWVKAETRLLAYPGTPQTGPYTLVRTGGKPPLVPAEQCALLRDLKYRDQHFCLVSTARDIP
jgi:hypothetical protein